MTNTLELSIPKDSQEEIKEFVSVLLLLPKKDKAILLSNANAFKTRNDIEKIRANAALRRMHRSSLRMPRQRKSG